MDYTDQIERLENVVTFTRAAYLDVVAAILAAADKVAGTDEPHYHKNFLIEKFEKYRLQLADMDWNRYTEKEEAGER